MYYRSLVKTFTRFVDLLSVDFVPLTAERSMIAMWLPKRKEDHFETFPQEVKINHLLGQKKKQKTKLLTFVHVPFKRGGGV